MALVTYTPPTAWTDKSMDWTNPDPTCLDYAYALYLACRERAATSWNRFMREMDIPAVYGGTKIIPPAPGDPVTSTFYRQIYTFLIQLVAPGEQYGMYHHAYSSGTCYWTHTPLTIPQNVEAYAPINPDTFQPVPLAITSADFEAAGIALSSTIPDRNDTDLTAWKNFLIAAKACLDMLTCQIVAIRHISSLDTSSGEEIEIAQMGLFYKDPDATIGGATAAAILNSWGAACDKLAAYRSYSGYWTDNMQISCDYTYDNGDVTKDFYAPSDEEGALYAVHNKFPFACRIYVRASKTMPAQTDKENEETSRFFDFGLGLSVSAWTKLVPASAAPPTVYDHTDLIWEDQPQPITPLASLFPGGDAFPPGMTIISAPSSVTVPTPPQDADWIVTEQDRPEEIEDDYFSETSYLYLGFLINAIAADFACAGGFKFCTISNQQQGA